MKPWSLFLLLLASGIAILSGYYVVKNYHYSLWTGSDRYTDFKVYYKAGVRFTTNTDSTYLDQEVTPETGGTYNYPPFALLYFAPISNMGYVNAYTVFSLISIIASCSIAFMVLQLMKEYFTPPTRAQTIAAYILTASFTPVWQDMKHGQVNALVALSVLIFLWFLLRQRYGRAALALFMGFWLKIYASLFIVFALPFLFRRNVGYISSPKTTKPWNIILYFILGAIVPPLIVSFYIPLNLYKYYFVEYLPRLSGVTSLAGFNQSLYGMIARITHSDGNLVSWKFVHIDLWMKLVVVFCTISLLGFIIYRIRQGSVKNLILTVYISMALIPIISQYGWEYVYIFALPLVLQVCLRIFSNTNVTKYSIFAITGLLLFWIPKPSDGFIESSLAYIPPGIYQFFFVRWIFAVVLIYLAALECFKDIKVNSCVSPIIQREMENK